MQSTTIETTMNDFHPEVMFIEFQKGLKRRLLVSCHNVTLFARNYGTDLGGDVIDVCYILSTDFDLKTTLLTGRNKSFNFVFNFNS
jgi:hypothetical protein